MSIKKVFTTGQVAKICKVAPRTVSKWYDSGRLKGYRIPGSQDRRIPREQLIRFLKEYGMPLGDLEEEELHKILLVGTCTTFNDRLKLLLSDTEEFRYERADTAFQAGTLLLGFAPDTIIVDLRLGRGDCVAMVQAIRKLEAYASTLILGLPGEDEADPELLKNYGFDDVFKRPFDVAILAERVRTVAEAKRES